MTTASLSISAPAKPELRVGTRIDSEAFASIRRRMILDFCKWDPQVGDVSTLCDFPLVLSRRAWHELARAAELLTHETLAMENALLDRPELWGRLGLPRRLRQMLQRSSDEAVTPAACRVMRFDFHPTRDGWRISEVNSDVPGGFSEASAFPRMIAQHVEEAEPAGDPAEMLVESLGRIAAANGRAIALLAAPGFMEDQQVVSVLARRLRHRDVNAIIAEPRSVEWIDGRALLRSSGYDAQIGAIVRFYQGEWLARISRRFGCRNLFVGARTPLTNPGCAILTESKRLPVVWNALRVACPTWKRLLPETRDPCDAPWSRDEGWLLKTAFCNTGDSVTARDLIPKRTWRRRWFDVLLNPGQWIAQRRFETTAFDTPIGPVYPCIGVYTIDGKACGIYGRLSTGPVVTYAAMDVAVLVERESEELSE
jgi:glutathionylspermidine synthase